jgi:hypothetical protein
MECEQEKIGEQVRVERMKNSSVKLKYLISNLRIGNPRQVISNLEFQVKNLK